MIVKYYTWARKIEEMVLYMIDNNWHYAAIKLYLSKCAKRREKYVGDPEFLTIIERHHTAAIQHFFDEYGVTDPISEAIEDEEIKGEDEEEANEELDELGEEDEEMDEEDEDEDEG